MSCSAVLRKYIAPTQSTGVQAGLDVADGDGLVRG